MADMGAFGAGLALGVLDGKNENQKKLIAQINALNETVGAQNERYQALKDQYDLLVKRFGQERGTLLGAARTRRYYRLAAHELSGADYEEVDAFVKQAMEKKDPQIESEVDRVQERRRQDDLAMGLDIFKQKQS